MKQLFCLFVIAALLCGVEESRAQVGIGIGTETPQAALDITSANKGLLVPRVALAATNNTAPVINPQGDALVNGTLVYNTAAAGTAPNNVAPGFYYWKDTAWIPLRHEASGGGSLNAAYDFGGNGAGRVITADAGAVHIGGADGMLVTGTFGEGADIETTGEGTRMFFNPKKAAFRTGYVLANQWDDSLTGMASAAFGLNTTASGEASTAMGLGTTASGTNSTAMGTGTTASGFYATAMGNANTAAGRYATAAGVFNTAPSWAETVVGSYSTEYTAAAANDWDAGDRLFTIGNGTDFANRSDAMVVLKNGNTGLGTSTPAARLDVTGSVKITDGTQGTGKVLTSDENGNASWQNATEGFTLPYYGATTGHALSLESSDPDMTSVADFRATATTGSNRAVYANISSGQGTAIMGIGVSSLGNAIGIEGGSNSENGTGIRGMAYSPTGVNIGVMGRSNSINGIGGSFENNFLEGTALHTGAGNVKFNVLSGENTRMVVADNQGVLSTQAIPAGSGGTLDTSYDFGGNGAGRVITADAGAVHIGGADGMLVTGTFGEGADIETTGEGTRMFFNPKKAAFRTGYVLANQWDDSLTGMASAAFGLNTTASGEASTAMGLGTTASGTNSTAMGTGTTASGFYATAMGNANTAAGRYATAAGVFNTAPSWAETVVGSYSTEYTAAAANDWDAGDRLFTIGNGTDFANRSDAMVVLKNGNTGLGTSTPAARLDVTGSVKITDGTQGTGKVLTSDENGNATWQAAAGFNLPYEGTTAISGSGGIFVTNTEAGGYGLFGKSTAGANGIGVLGRSESPDGTGIRGLATATTGMTYGVSGSASSPDGVGGIFSNILSGLALKTNSGGVQFGALAGANTRMVVADALGNLSAQPMPDGGSAYTAGSGINITANTISANDISATNEIQTLALSGNNLSLSNGGGSVMLPSASLALPYSGMAANTGAAVFTIVSTGSTAAVEGINDADTAVNAVTGSGTAVRALASGSGGAVFAQSNSGNAGTFISASGNAVAAVSDGTALYAEGGIKLKTTGAASGKYLMATDANGTAEWVDAPSGSGGNQWATSFNGTNIFQSEIYNGTVGIGTNNPSPHTKLSIYGGGKPNGLYVNASTNDDYAISTTFGKINFGVNGGTTEKLEVNGAIKIGDASAAPSNGTIRYTAGGFEGRHGNTWQALGGSGSAGSTLDASYDNGGAGMGRTITADAGAVKIAGSDGLLVTGSHLSGSNLELNGSGTRMFFYPKKSAFRAGAVSFSAWDDANIGEYSVAAGYDATAYGMYAVSAGNTATASGQSSLALGNHATADGASAVALGFYTNALGNISTAMGYTTSAHSFAETAIGAYNTNYAPASTTSWNAADRLFVIGNGTSHFDRSDALMVHKNGNLTVSGNAFKPGGGSWAATSDARLKTGIANFNDGLQKVLEIHPVKYHYNEKSGNDTSKEHIGVIAQELQGVAPYMVSTFEQQGEEFLQVDNSAMTYMLINAVKEQQHIIDRQRREIEELKKDNGVLKASADAQQQLTARLQQDIEAVKVILMPSKPVAGNGN